MVLQPEIRKGPWTEQEDFKLAYFVGMFGDRRWDFIAKVSGLSRTGKSCRLRWVNYLHPDLKRGKMTPQEERLVLELHSKWGNRWSRIARKLPGRTDNEIKNYWRTYMRKKRAQEKKRASAAASAADSHASSTCQSSSLSSNTNTNNSNNNNPAAVDSHASKEAGEESFYDTGGPNMIDDAELQGYSMDDIWKDIAMSEDHSINNINLQPVEVYDGGQSEEGCNFSCPPLMPSPPTWDYNYYSSDPLWVMDIEEESKMLFPTIGGGGGDQYFSSSFYDQQASTAFLTG